ncbi:MAG TPA: PAS domain S-box protein [Rectinemataceae bacterium]|nr:PAS domain S-box protein [Rectinemataceae bacterium]
MPTEPRDDSPGFDALFELAPDIISILDGEGRYLSVSKSSTSLHGYEVSELLGRASTDFIHPDDRAAIAEATAKAFAEPGTRIFGRYRYLEKDGGYRWVDGSGICGRDGSGRDILVIISRDATKVVADEALLDQALREKDALLREIQHRVKNSIALISSFVALEEGRTGPGPLRSVLESLRFRVDSISTLYRILFSTGNPGLINLRAYFEKLILDISQTIERPEVSTRLDLVDFDFDTKRAGPLGILCSELVANALRHGFTEESRGFLSVRLAIEGDRLRLAVEDDGRGLPEGFDPSRQEGLGLQIARMLALQLKGTFSASGAEGGGSRFALDMPLEAMA